MNPLQSSLAAPSLPPLSVSHRLSLICASPVLCVAAGYRVDRSRRVQQVQVPVLQVCAVSTCDNHTHAFLTAQLCPSQAAAREQEAAPA